MIIKIKKLSDNARLPERMTEHAAGYDLRAALDSDISIEPGKLCMIPTGLAFSIPIGYEIQIRPRSGLAFKNNIGILNSPGTIDPDYRGEVKILLFNFGDKPFFVKNGERIAQMVIAKHEIFDFELTEILDDTDRGDGGFGHTLI